MRTEKRFILPEIALEMLQKNHLNRRTNHHTVECYARDMLAGKWKFTHQGILLGKGDTLIDGQHRLMAIVKSNCPQWMLVSYDETIESPVDVPVDIGRKREVAFIVGVEKPLAAISALSLRFTDDIVNPTPNEIHARSQILASSLTALRGEAKTSKRAVSSAPVQLAGVTRILLGENKHDYVSSSYRNMLSDNFRELEPIVASLYKQIVVDRTPTTNGRSIFTRAMRAFDPAKSHIPKLTIKNETYAFEEARELHKAAIAGASASPQTLF